MADAEAAPDLPIADGSVAGAAELTALADWLEGTPIAWEVRPRDGGGVEVVLVTEEPHVTVTITGDRATTPRDHPAGAALCAGLAWWAQGSALIVDLGADALVIETSQIVIAVDASGD